MLAKDERAAAARGQGCLGKASDDEPVFILRAQDRIADAVVSMWAVLADANGCSADKVAEARALAKAMREWPNRKYPD